MDYEYLRNTLSPRERAFIPSRLPHPDSLRDKLKPIDYRDYTDKGNDDEAQQGAGQELGDKAAERIGDHTDRVQEWGERRDEYMKSRGGSTANKQKAARLKFGKRPSPTGSAVGFFFDTFGQMDPMVPGGLLPDEPTDPNDPTRNPSNPNGFSPDQETICSRGGLNPNSYPSPQGELVQFVVMMRPPISASYSGPGIPYRRMGIIKKYYPNGFNRLRGISVGLTETTRSGELSQEEGVPTRGGRPTVRNYSWYQKSVSIPELSINWKSSVSVGYVDIDPTGFESGASEILEYFSSLIVGIDCIVGLDFIPDDVDYFDFNDPNDYDREVDDGMGCKWQKDEISYELPRLKIGNTEIGGSSINIDDGLLPLAQYLCSAMKMMHSGIGLDLLDVTDLPTSVLKPNDNKVKHKSIAELTQWQFDNVSSLVGLPIKNTLTTIDDKTSDLEFRSVQDALSFMFHQQKESDTDLTVLEGYCTRIAQQLEAVTQICLRQHADIEMIIQELGFKYKIETKTRPSLYKIGMKDDDPKTGVIELFKGGIVSYPVRIWADEHDQRQIAMRTNLYAEISARSILQTKNTKDEIAGLDAMKKMNKNNKEDWAEYIKTINEPESGTISGSRTPYIEEYVSGTLGTKKIPSPTSGLSLFRKPKQTGKIR